jgi:hypothetical protein
MGQLVLLRQRERGLYVPATVALSLRVRYEHLQCCPDLFIVFNWGPLRQPPKRHRQQLTHGEASSRLIHLPPPIGRPPAPVSVSANIAGPLEAQYPTVNWFIPAFAGHVLEIQTGHHHSDPSWSARLGQLGYFLKRQLGVTCCDPSNSQDCPVDVESDPDVSPNRPIGSYSRSAGQWPNANLSGHLATDSVLCDLRRVFGSLIERR